MRSTKRGLLLVMVVIFVLNSCLTLATMSGIFGPGTPPPHALTTNFSDTKWIPGTPWLYSSGDILYFNESYLNTNINDTDTWWPILSPYLINNSNRLDFNESQLNITINEIINLLNIVNGTDGINGINGTDGADGADGADGINGLNGTDGTTFNVDGNYLYNTSNTVYFNESYLNETIEALDTNTDTWWGILGPYLFNNSGSLDFNESYLNETIDARDTNTWWDILGPYLFNNSNQLTFNESQLNQTIQALDTDTHATAGGDYLYNDSTTIFLNETELNQSVVELINITAIWIRNSSGVYLRVPPDNVTIEGELIVTGSGYFGNNSVYIGDIKMSQGANGELNISKNVSAPYFIGDGSKLWNISELWFNVSNVGTFYGDINVTGDGHFQGDVYVNESSLKFVASDGSIGKPK